jgi:hypothetical protein
MKKWIGKIAIVLGALLLVFMIWDMIFNEAGVLSNVWDGFAGWVNGMVSDFTGEDTEFIPLWNIDNSNDVAEARGNAGF